jgi:methionine-rich copper-binding protein CopC
MARKHPIIRGIRRHIERARVRRALRTFERLEDRSLLSTTPLGVLWAPDTPQSVVDAFEDQVAELNGADIGHIEAHRWTSTSTDPGPLGQGDATTLTWSIMDDGAEIGGFVGEATSPSNLQTRLNALYGSSDTWLPLFQQVFDRWEFLSGIDFVFEPNDDGSPMSQVNVGQPGIRGDLRLGGHFIDGNSNTLAYNFFPGFGGDMVIDTADNFLDDLSNNSLVLRTIIAHEAGHGIGQFHTTPIVNQKVMEPNINLEFDGPQHDDVLRIQRGYGDRFERNGGNDTADTAASIGPLTVTPVVLGQATVTPYDHSDVDDYVSIDDDSDVDYYRFSLSAPTSVDISVAPVGTQYGTGIHGEGNPAIIDSRLLSDLRLVVLNSNGTTERANVNATGLGGSESVVNLNLPAGEYFIRISGAQNAAQLYRLTASSDLPAAGTISGSLWHDVDGDNTRDAGEVGLAGWTVFLDSTSNGVLDAGERTTVTSATGTYSFSGLPAATHRVAIVVQPGWQQTFPAATGGGAGPRTHTVTLTANQTVGDRNFASRLASSSINGSLWNDADGDGTRDTGEASLSGWTVFLDRDADGTLDTGETQTVTTGTGAYSFSGLLAGTYTVAIVVQSGWQQTFPAATGGGTGPRTHSVTLTAGQTAGDINFGNGQATASINGLLWHDVDADGARDTGEAVLSDWTVFLDSDADGALDGSEPQTATNGTGAYSFTGLLAGTYTVAIVVQPDWQQTFPAATGGGTGPRTHTVTLAAGQTLNNINFGNVQPLPGDPPAPPELAAIGNKTMPASQNTLQLNLVATDPNDDPLTFSAVGQSIEHHLDQTLGLTSVSGDYLNWGGRNEKWMSGSANSWFYIVPDGRLFRWLGGNLANDPLVEQLSPATYANLALLHSAQPNNAPASLTINGSTLVIDPNNGFVGKFFVTVTVSDGSFSDSEKFQVTVQADGADTTPPTVSNRTPAAGATISTATTNIDITFSEPVTGVDVTDLVLSGSGATGAVKAAPVNTSGNVWRFAVSGLQNGPVNVSLAPDAGDIEDAAGNDLAPASWSFTVSISTTQSPPVLAPIGNQTMSSSQDTLSLNLAATDPNNDPLTFSATAQSIEYHLDQTLGLTLDGGNDWFNYAGLNEKWMKGNNNTWFYIRPDGRLFRQAGGNIANDPLIEQLSTATYANIALLHSAQPNNAPATVSVNGSTLLINPNDGFVGKFVVTAAVSDGALTDSEVFQVIVQAAGPDTTPPTVTNRTPASGATITTAAANIDITFSEPVTGVDVTDLVLSGAGSTGAVKAAPVSMGGNVWRFAVSNLQNGPVNVALAPDAGDIEDAAGNDLAPTSWSFTVSVADTGPPTVINRTPAAGATVTTATTNIDITFSEPVTGVDVTDLVLSGGGATSAVKAAPVNMGGNVWRFTVSNLQNGPVNASLAPDAGDIEDAAGNDLAPTSWSFTVALPTTQSPPVLSSIGDQTMSTLQDTLTLNLTATDPDNDPLTFSATAQSIEYHLDQTLGLVTVGGNEYFNWGGFNEKWFTGANNTSYYITPDGKLYRWLGGFLANDPLVEQVSVAAYTNTALLHSAQPNNAPATLTVNGSTLVINPNAGFRGKFIVTVTVSDGQGNTDSEQFRVNVT